MNTRYDVFISYAHRDDRYFLPVVRYGEHFVEASDYSTFGEVPVPDAIIGRYLSKHHRQIEGSVVIGRETYVTTVYEPITNVDDYCYVVTTSDGIPLQTDASEGKHYKGGYSPSEATTPTRRSIALDIRWSELVQALSSRIGSVAKLADKLTVDSRILRRWLSTAASPTDRHVDALLDLALAENIRPESYARGPALWSPRDSFEANIAYSLDAPPVLLTALRDHAVEFLGHRVQSPFGVATSVITATSDRIRYLAATGCDIITFKTVRSTRYRSQLPPNLFVCSAEFAADPLHRSVEIDGVLEPERGGPGLVNSFGIPSVGPEEWQTEFRQAQRSIRPDQLLILSVVGTPDESGSMDSVVRDFGRVVQLGVEAGATVLELNLSCPNLGGVEGYFFQDLASVIRICRRVREVATKARIILKIGVLQSTALKEFVMATADLCDGYSAINALPVDGFQRAGPTVPVRVSPCVGLTGKPLLSLGLRCVREIAEIRRREHLEHLMLIGSGGVSSPLDVLAYLDSGADVVQAATAFLEDSCFGLKVRPMLDERLRSGLRPSELDRQKAFENWSQSVVVLLRHSPDELHSLVLSTANEVFQEWERSFSENPEARSSRISPSSDIFRRRIRDRLLQLRPDLPALSAEP